MRMFGFNDVSSFDTLDHDKHRMRRELWNPYFSKQQVSCLQPMLIQPLVDKLCDRLAEYQAAKRPVTMIYAFANLTSDIISEYSFSKGYGNLERPDFHGDDYNAWMALSKMSHLLKQFGWLFPMMYSFPLWVTKFTSPETYRILCQQNDLFQQAQEAISQRNRMEIKETTGRVPIMQAFLNSNLPESEKAADRMKAEAQSAISAGTLTTSHALKVATYHVLANPPILTKLMDELYQFGAKAGSPLHLQQLERMPYLMAIWYESLRHFHGACHRLQRVFPDTDLRYKEWVIPPGTPVGMTSLHVHESEEIFSDHYAFHPERWLPLQTEGQRLLKYMVAFGAGSRSCVGRELGKAEFLTTMATMFRRFGKDMELYDTYRERDVDIKHDYFNPAPSDESNGLMVSFNKK